MNERRALADDILYRLRAEKRERAEAIRIPRASACAGSRSIREDSHIHSLTPDAVAEITRVRLLLAEKVKLPLSDQWTLVLESRLRIRTPAIIRPIPAKPARSGRWP